jgi:hypothetical protein
MSEGVLFGQGTMLDIAHVACRFAGSMPVAVGMVLKARIAPPQRRGSSALGRFASSAAGLAYGVSLRSVGTVVAATTPSAE